MRIQLRRFIAVAVPLAAALASSGLHAQQRPPDPNRYESTIAAFEGRPHKPLVVFVGSSSIRRWNLTEYFPDLNMINHGFGGSEMADLPRYATRIVVPQKPASVVVNSRRAATSGITAISVLPAM